MQWDDTENAGFTTGTPWLKVNPNYKEINVKKDLEDGQSIYRYMQSLIRMRKANEIAVYGDFKEYEPDNTQLYIYERNWEDEQMFVVLNFSEEKAMFRLPEEWSGKETELLISNYPEERPLSDLELLPYEAVVYKTK